jgi:hypothetical protein
VFDVDQRPWIFHDGADPDDFVEVVARCPTGALRTHPKSSKSEHRSPRPRSTLCPAALCSSAATSESAVQASTNRRPAPPCARAAARATCPTATGAVPAQTGRTHTAVSRVRAARREPNRIPAELFGVITAVITNVPRFASAASSAAETSLQMDTWVNGPVLNEVEGLVAVVGLVCRRRPNSGPTAPD